MIWLLSLLLFVPPTFHAYDDVDRDGDVDLRDWAAFQNGDHIDSGYLDDYADFEAWFAGPGCDAFATRYQGRRLTVFCGDPNDGGRIWDVDLR